MSDAFLVVVWMGLWMLGGIWLAGAAFRLDNGERLLVGITTGLALENLLANLLARFLPFPTAIWGAAGLTALFGFVLALRHDEPRSLLRLPLAWRTLAALAALIALSLLCFGLGRGFGLFDEFLQLPTISLMATGDVPPRFALDPSVPYEYHYFLLFTAAQVMRIGSVLPWTALDLMRGLTTGLALCLAFYWTKRITRSSIAGVLGASFLFFASGTRWLLLLIPQDQLRAISSGIELLGSGAASGTDLSAALASPWAIEGAGPIPFPFAFANGIIPPGVLLQFVANGLTEYAIILTLLLVFSRRRGWVGNITTALFFSALALLTEAGIILELGGLGLAILITVIRRKSLILPRSLWIWLSVVLGGLLLSSWQRGAFWGIILRAARLNQTSDYHTIGFQFVFPPTVVSSQLGVLSLGQVGPAVIALVELGPLLLTLPLLFAWGWKAARAGRWYEAALVGEAFLGLGILFIQFTGSEGIRNTSRLYRFPFILVIFAVPLVWNWLKRRGAAARWTAAVLGAMTLFGGLGIFSAQIPALQKPVYTYFISEMDVRMLNRQWNRLEPGALVFDLVPFRAPTILGRYTNSSTTWYALKPEWKALFHDPMPAALHAYGFDYAYMDNFNFANLAPDIQKAWENPCVHLVEKAAYEGYWRRLFDIRECR